MRRVVQRSRRRQRRPGDLEVGTCRVVDDEQDVAARLDVVFDPLAPRGDDAQRAGRVREVEEAMLTRRPRARHDDEPALVPRRGDAEPEALVGLGEDPDVRADVGAHLMAPHLVGSPGLVDPGVEDVASVAGPDHPVADVTHRVVEDLARRDVANPQGEPLVAAQVEGVGEAGAVVTHLARADGEELAVAGLDVAVEEDLLPGRGRRRLDPARLGPRRRLWPLRRLSSLRRLGQLGARLTRHDPDPRPDRILLPLHGAPVVPPAAVGDGHAEIALLRACLDLLEEPRAQRLQRRGHRLGVGVLGAQVGQHLLVARVGQPRVDVVELVTVVPAQVRPLLRDGGGEHDQQA